MAITNYPNMSREVTSADSDRPGVAEIARLMAEKDILLRFADTKDIQRVGEIISQLSPQAHNYKKAEEKFERFIKNNPDYFLWVAEYQNEVVGTGMLHLHHKLSYNCGTGSHLEDVVVDKPFRGMGIGDLIVKTAIETSISYDCYKIMLTCWERSVPYYRDRHGFKVHDIGMKISLKDLY